MSQEKDKNKSLALSLLAIVAGMAMLAYASVPLYRLFCISTGFGGTAQKSEDKAVPVLDRQMTVRFDANTATGLPWEFVTLTKEVTLPIGQKKNIAYRATNHANSETRGTATFNVTPVKAGKYFHKVQCFCFSDQTLKPGESKELDVFFYIDPDITQDKDLDDVSTITLSYTFFPVNK